MTTIVEYTPEDCHFPVFNKRYSFEIGKEGHLIKSIWLVTPLPELDESVAQWREDLPYQFVKELEVNMAGGRIHKETSDSIVWNYVNRYGCEPDYFVDSKTLRLPLILTEFPASDITLRIELSPAESCIVSKDENIHPRSIDVRFPKSKILIEYESCEKTKINLDTGMPTQLTQYTGCESVDKLHDRYKLHFMCVTDYIYFTFRSHPHNQNTEIFDCLESARLLVNGVEVANYQAQEIRMPNVKIPIYCIALPAPDFLRIDNVVLDVKLQDNYSESLPIGLRIYAKSRDMLIGINERYLTWQNLCYQNRVKFPYQYPCFTYQVGVESHYV